MKEVIRRGCFETNSSSMHSIVVTKDDNLVTPEEVSDQLYSYNDYKFRVWDDEDLWYERSPFRYLTSFREKIWFAIASYCAHRSEEEAEVFISDLVEMVRKYAPEFNGFQFPEYENEDEARYYKYGDIDHQSAGLLQGFLTAHNISIQEFIFNNKYKVIIDGDEYCIFESMVKDGLISTENVVEIYPTINGAPACFDEIEEKE